MDSVEQHCLPWSGLPAPKHTTFCNAWNCRRESGSLVMSAIDFAYSSTQDCSSRVFASHHTVRKLCTLVVIFAIHCIHCIQLSVRDLVWTYLNLLDPLCITVVGWYITSCRILFLQAGFNITLRENIARYFGVPVGAAQKGRPGQLSHQKIGEILYYCRSVSCLITVLISEFMNCVQLGDANILRAWWYLLPWNLNTFLS